MTVNIALLGPIILVWMIIAMTITILLVKRKTETPAITIALSFMLSLIPPISYFSRRTGSEERSRQK
jgi:hypothetical protein